MFLLYKNHNNIRNKKKNNNYNNNDNINLVIINIIIFRKYYYILNTYKYIKNIQFFQIIKIFKDTISQWTKKWHETCTFFCNLIIFESTNFIFILYIKMFIINVEI